MVSRRATRSSTAAALPQASIDVPKVETEKDSNADHTQKSSDKQNRKQSKVAGAVEGKGLLKGRARSGQRRKSTKAPRSEADDHGVEDTSPAPSGNASTSKYRRSRAVSKPKADVSVLPHGLGINAEETHRQFLENGNASGRSGNVASPTPKSDQNDHGADANSERLEAGSQPDSKPVKVRKSGYGVVLGQTPYPDHVRPTAEECHLVNDILSKEHGRVSAPEKPPMPSSTVAGCGEVPFVLEALMRTHLSGHTSMANAARAIQGEIQRFGISQSGRDKGCINWNDIRLASQAEVEEAIRRGGMAPTKSKQQKTILDKVFRENRERREKLRQRKSKETQTNGSSVDPDQAGEPTIVVPKNAALGTKNAAAMVAHAEEILLSSLEILTLDYLHAMSAEEAFEHLTTYPGIGVKTAACVLLFCMQRPLFAVDTHVYRLCKWLGWVPPQATRETCFAHCDVRVPDELKYSLHQLMIAHGKTCGRCRSVTSENSAGWAAGCPLEEYLTRTGARKGGAAEEPKPSKKRKMKKKEKDVEEDDEEDEDDEADKGAGDVEVKPPAAKRTKTKARRNEQRVSGDVEATEEHTEEKVSGRGRKVKVEQGTKDEEGGMQQPAKENAITSKPQEKVEENGTKGPDENKKEETTTKKKKEEATKSAPKKANRAAKKAETQPPEAAAGPEKRRSSRKKK